MIEIKIRYLGILAKLVGGFSKEVKVAEGTTLKQIIDQHIQTYGEEFKKWVFVKEPDETIVSVFLNGRPVDMPELVPARLDTIMSDGDEILFGGAGLIGGA